MPDLQRIKLLRDTAQSLLSSNVVLMDGEVCLIDSTGDDAYDSLVIGDGVTKARSLNLIPLNVSKGAVFLGTANLQTIPGTPTGQVFYLATQAGTYEGFGNAVVNAGEIAFLLYRYGGWNKITVLQVDSSLSESSENPVQNKVVYRALKDLENKIINGEITGPIDSELSDISENPIMNKAVSTKFNEFDWYEAL